MNELTPYQHDMVAKIRALRKLFEETGFRSNKSQTGVVGVFEPDRFSSRRSGSSEVIEREIENENLII